MGTPAAATPRCAALSRAADESLHATAPVEAGWLLVEQAPPWGREALLESGLDATVAAELSRRAARAGVKVLLIRRNGAPTRPERRSVLVAWTGRGPFVESLTLAGDAGLLDVDVDGLARGERPGGTVIHERLTLVCTNGRRDACCALYGPRTAAALRSHRPEETWECSHIGGHRFAATMLCLPSGACFGRLDATAAVRVVESLDRGVVDLHHLRGFAGRAAPVQAAEMALRTRLGLDRVEDVEPIALAATADAAEVRLRTRDGVEHVVRVEKRRDSPRRVSCAGEIEPVSRWEPAWAVSQERW